MADFQTHHVDPTPLVNAVTGAYNAVTTVVTAVVEQGGNLSAEAQQNINNILGGTVGGILDKLDAHVKGILDKIKEVYTTAPPLPATPPSIDLVETLNQISLAIKRAEEVLNEQNLVIVKGTVEAELNVKLPAGDGPGAHARITFDITPKPIA